MRITNTMALTAHRNMNMHWQMMQRSMERLSSGMRINRAADDPAGLAISERMRAQIRGLKQASRNAQAAISLLQVAEGALNETSSMLQRIRELCVQAATGTNSPEDLEAIQMEIEQLLAQIDRISSDTQFNTMPLFDRSDATDTKDGGQATTVDNETAMAQAAGAVFRIQIGANAGQYMEIRLGNMSTQALGISNLDVRVDADNAISVVDKAIQRVASERSSIGAYQNRLEHTINNLEQTALNLQAAESRIRDADLAEEMMNYTRHNILYQVAMAMLAQANMAQQSILQLLNWHSPMYKR